MKGCAAGGCLGGCALVIGVPLLLAALVVALAGALGGALGGAAPLAGAGGTLGNLGYGPSDATRIERAIARRTPGSPLRGHGAMIVAVAEQAGLDPLLLVGVWALESQLCTDGLNTPPRGNWNCGNMIWDAMRLHATPARWGCRAGDTSLNHRWGRCDAPEGGVGIWFEYVAGFYGAAMPLAQFAGIYNPCSDPENAKNGFPCGDQYARNITAVLTAVAGSPVGAGAVGATAGMLADAVAVTPFEPDDVWSPGCAS